MENSKTLEISIFNVIAVILSATFAIYSQQIVAAIGNVIKSLAKPPPDPKIIAQKSKIAEIQKELNGISHTGEFAKYTKKERELTKAREELEEMESEKTSEKSRNLKIDTVTRVVLQFSALALLRYVSSITAYCIPSSIFWPFNILIGFPAVFGNDSCPAEFAEVSGFALAFLMIHLINLVWKSIFSKSENIEKKTN